MATADFNQVFRDVILADIKTVSLTGDFTNLDTLTVQAQVSIKNADGTENRELVVIAINNPGSLNSFNAILNTSIIPAINDAIENEFGVIFV